MKGSIGADVAIAGGGIIGLSVGLELLRRGLSVIVVERGQAMSSASWAAAGMLAVHDPQNPAALMPLCVRSWELYSEYLERVEMLSGLRVPQRTQWAMQYVAAGSKRGVTAEQIAEFAPGLDLGGQGFEWLEEGSVDPNDLRDALPAAFVTAGGRLLEGTEMLGVTSAAGGVLVRTAGGGISAGVFVNCRGAWAGGSVTPVKGQMVNLRCAPERLRCVVRAPGIYLVPRGDGRVTAGATIEHVGFDETVAAAAVGRLVEVARRLLPEVEGPVKMGPKAGAWAGLRPGTPDGLPILGAAEEEHCWHATGHYRDGILLAPVTARVMAQAMLGETPDVPLEAFAVGRF